MNRAVQLVKSLPKPYDAMIAKLEADRRRLAAVEEVDGRRSDVAWVASTDVPARAAMIPARRSRAVWLVYAVAERMPGA